MSQKIPSSILKESTSNFHFYILAGLIGGGLLVFVEAIDRLLTLRFPTYLDQVLFVCTLAMAPIGNVFLGSFIAILALKAKFLLLLLNKQLKISTYLQHLLVALSISSPFILLTFFFPTLFADNFQGILTSLSSRGIPFGPIIGYSKFLLSFLIYFFALVIVFLESERFNQIVKGNWVILLFVLMVLIMGVAYYADSRIFVGRYQEMFHIPLALIAILSSFMAGLLIVEQRFNFAPKHIILVIIPAFIFTFAHQSINKHQAMKASFWRRGVVVKNYLILAQRLYDFDGDGFSRFFDGGDYNDKNSTYNPTAIDSPNNNIDENAFGGDFKLPLQNPAEVNQKPIPSASAKNVLFITIDCLRADHLGTYGYAKKLSPNIDALAARSLVFENGYALGTNTGHSFTGIARSNYGEGLFNDEIPTLAELFSQQGYITTTITSPETSKWLQKQGWETYKTVMLKGFQNIVHEEGGNWNSRKLTDHTIEYLQTKEDKPFYLWVHYNDLHAKAEKYHKQDKQDTAKTSMEIYDSNLHFTDKHLGRLFEYLESSGLINNTVIAISADHGEEFNEHGQLFHNGRPYRVQTHVPVILYYPGGGAKRINTPVSTIDFAPTFLRLTGKLPPKSYKGVDLIETALGNISNRLVIMETPRNVPDSNFFAWAIVDKDWRFVYDLVGNTFELYNQKDDPLEQNNLIDKETEKAVELKKKFGIWLDEQTQDKHYRYWQKF
ncbi:MAG: sulfatase-like hydrolase/transferase [Acidobacteria bacterium]|nr:sulfatase-like hydrolase/transferase [Acidobacteriota bacterium]